MPRFISGQQAQPKLDRYNEYQEQLKMKSRPSSCPEPRTALYQPHRPRTCRPRDRLKETPTFQVIVFADQRLQRVKPKFNNFITSSLSYHSLQTITSLWTLGENFLDISFTAISGSFLDTLYALSIGCVFLQISDYRFYYFYDLHTRHASHLTCTIVH